MVVYVFAQDGRNSFLINSGTVVVSMHMHA